MKVLVSVPQSGRNSFFLPYIWAVLKTTCDEIPYLKKNLEWLDPIWLFDNPSDLVKDIDFNSIDILALSCYTWNMQLQFEIAKIAKEKNPNIITIAGGPELDYSNKNCFEKYKDIDIIVIKDGEPAFRSLMRTLIDGSFDLSSIPNLVLGPKFGNFCTLNKPSEPINLYKSPWLEQKDYFKKLIDIYGPGKLSVTHETNRGCPYACTFCDWGSQTASKIRLRDLNLIKEELEFLILEVKPDIFYQADANFGIFKHDLEIAKIIGTCKLQSGYPRSFFYNFSKNNTERNSEIATILFQHKAITYFNLSLQHTDQIVLSNIDRGTIDLKKIIPLVKILRKKEIPIVTQLILGNPGDTEIKWRKNFYRLMEWGVHSEFKVFTFEILPNAPAADQEYIKKWKIKTLSKSNSHLVFEANELETDKKYYAKSRIIIQTKTFNEKNWIEMIVFYSAISCLHSYGLVRAFAFYKKILGMSFEQFYESLLKYLNQNSKIWKKLTNQIREHYRNFIDDENTVFGMHLRQDRKADPEEWLLYSIIIHSNEFFEDILCWAKSINVPQDLIDYQINSLYLFNYKNETFDITNFKEWNEWYKKCLNSMNDEWEIPTLSNEITTAKLILDGRHNRIQNIYHLQNFVTRNRGLRNKLLQQYFKYEN